MATDMDSDFQLFSPTQPPIKSDPQENLLFPDSARDDSNQDWTQWMRWDDQFGETSNDQPQSVPDLPPISQNENADPAVLSQNVSLDFAKHPLGSFTGDGNAMEASQPSSTPAQTISNLSPASTGNRKRKSTSDDDGSASGMLQDGRKALKPKRPHNVIEKRYRANLNDKITELRDSVPALRTSKGNGNALDDDDASSGKLNKASILSKATDYIRHLEIRNKRLEEENTGLKNRMRQVDKAADQSLTSTASVSSPSNRTVSTESGASSSPSIFSHGEDLSDHSPSSLHPPEGLMKVPDSFKRMWETTPQDSSYGQSYIKGRPIESEAHGRKRSRFPNKYMVGALAGLMVLEGMGTEKETDSTAKGLLAVPVNLLNNAQLPSMGHWQAVLRGYWYSWHVKAAVHFLILAGLVVGSAFAVFVYLFNSQPRRHHHPLKSAPADTTSPSSFRRQAWLTSIQQVGVPRHSFFREWYAVTSRCFEYVLRCFSGWKLYSWLTGITEEDEKGRVKTWDIAIDAQLAGGDLEISRSRLVLTVFAAGTLPRIPMRMMQKALHCRILLWRVGDPGSWSFHISNDVARAIARYQWEQARKLQRLLPEDHPDALPSHLAALLTRESDDVMIDKIVQRAANLTWNRPTREGTDDDEALLDIVDEDPAIQSYLDAFAAWQSGHQLQNALLRYFEASSGSADAKKSRDTFKEQIKFALDVAPQPSAAHTRALVMNAVFREQNRVENVGKVLSALPSDKGEDKQCHASNFLDSSLPISVREEIAIAVRCAMIAAVFTARTGGDDSLPASFTLERATTWFNKLALDPVELTLLGFAAVYHLLHVLAADTDYLLSDSSSPSTPLSEEPPVFDNEPGDVPEICKRGAPEKSIPNIGRVAAELIYWARNAYNPAYYGFTAKIVDMIERECTSLCDRVGVDVADYLEARQERKRKSQAQDDESDHKSPERPEDTVDTTLNADDCTSQHGKVPEGIAS
jgi:hypothetical protein